MRTTVGGRARSGRIGVVRILFFSSALLVVAAAVAVLFLRRARDSSFSSSADIKQVLSRLDAAPAGRNGAAEAWELTDRAAAFVAAKGLGVESELAVLKRRRALARSYPDEYAVPYLLAATFSAERFPHADLVAAAVVDAALLRPGESASAALKAYAPRLDSSSFGALKTLAYARLGETAEPSTVLPSSALLAASAAYVPVRPEAAALLAVDAAIAALLSDNALEARTIARDRLSLHDGLSPSVILFLAELSYDFGDRNEASSFFSRLSGAEYALRRADSAYLAADGATAREAWLQAIGGTGTKLALYNLASVSADAAEALSYARRLRSYAADFSPGVILYSRLAADDPAGFSSLASAAAASRDSLVDLELIRVEARREGYERTMARLWLLMNEHPRSEPLARWASWFAASRGRLPEAMRIVRAYGSENGNPPWTEFYAGLDGALSGRHDEAEKSFERAAAESGDWRLAADTAALYESRRNPREALRRYEIAASLCPAGPDAAEIQLRISRLLSAMGRSADARRVLEYALDQDPGNRRVRTELKRLDGR